MTARKPKPSQAMLELYDTYAHGMLDRRAFMEKLGAYAVGGVTAAMLAQELMPDYARADQVAEGDTRIEGADIPYPSPKGAGEMMGYLVKPKGTSGAMPRAGVVVIHENRGLNPYIRDVARRLAVAGYVAFAPDALFPLGGYPGNDDEGRSMQRSRSRDAMVEDFIAAVAFLQAHPDCTGTVGCVGFCFGGSVSNELAARVPSLKAAVPFYGGAPDTDAVPAINAPLMLHFAGLDTRVNASWPAYKAALEANGKSFEAFVYDGVNHGFHNDTTPRYDAEAAELAWARTLAFFAAHLS